MDTHRPFKSLYHIIGGCFWKRRTRTAFISELQAKGFAASLVDRKGGLYGVAYGSYPLKSTAVEALEAVRKEEAPDVLDAASDPPGPLALILCT